MAWLRPRMLQSEPLSYVAALALWMPCVRITAGTDSVARGGILRGKTNVCSQTSFGDCQLPHSDMETSY